MKISGVKCFAAFDLLLHYYNLLSLRNLNFDKFVRVKIISPCIFLMKKKNFKMRGKKRFSLHVYLKLSYLAFYYYYE